MRQSDKGQGKAPGLEDTQPLLSGRGMTPYKAILEDSVPSLVERGQRVAPHGCSDARMGVPELEPPFCFHLTAGGELQKEPPAPA